MSCEILAWCPVEVNKLPIKNGALLEDSQYFTLLIKNFVHFPKFQCKRRNILDSQNPSYLKSCHYNSESPVDRLCPVFRIGDIVSEAHRGRPNASYDSIAILGGVIAINIEWDCNLDNSIDECLPKYKFKRLDAENAKIAKGSNFRYASVYEKEGVMYRNLFKAYGIRFIIKVSGKAGKFGIVPLLQNIGSGVGLLALASVLCDIILLHTGKKRHIYKQKKILYVHRRETAHKNQVTRPDDV
jgi:P2X purinoceptor 4